MLLVKEAIKRVTKGSIAYSPLRDIYQLLFDRRSWDFQKQMIGFYGQFIPEGGLVFDIGANVGVYTELFLKLGAHVVASEPNPECIRALQAVRAADRVAIEPVALADAEGEATLFRCNNSALSTLSAEWVKVAHNTRRFGSMHWTQETRVRVTTLDALICKYGRPEFIKIDVEGFERQVLRGLSKAPRHLSFEFNTEYLEAAIECLSSPCFSESAEFNMVIANSPVLTLPQWVTSGKMAQIMSSTQMRSVETYGDIFVRDTPK